MIPNGHTRSIEEVYPVEVIVEDYGEEEERHADGDEVREETHEVDLQDVEDEAVG